MTVNNNSWDRIGCHQQNVDEHARATEPQQLQFFLLDRNSGLAQIELGTDSRAQDHHAIVTRMSALQDIASMDVLCSDKTGTLTTAKMSINLEKIWTSKKDGTLKKHEETSGESAECLSLCKKGVGLSGCSEMGCRGVGWECYIVERM